MRNSVKKALLLCLLVSAFCGCVFYAPEASAKKKSKLEKSVEAIVNKQVVKKDKKAIKLEKLFQFVTFSQDGKETFKYAAVHPTVVKGKKIEAWTKKGWPAKFAQEMISKKKGSCYHYAAIYGYLAKKATGYTVRVCVGKTSGFGDLTKHAWTEIKIGKTWYICDTNLDKYATSEHGTYFLKKRSSLKKIYNNFKGVKKYTIKF